MNTKRATQEGHYSQATNSFSQLIDEDLRRQLASVGPRARKHVSEGHLTAQTSIPSLEGTVIGTLDQSQIRSQYYKEMAARPSYSTGDVGIKRMRDNFDDDDEYGDTEDDEEESNKPSVDNQRKVFYRPNSHKSFSSQQDDFEEADFLHSQK